MITDHLLMIAVATFKRQEHRLDDYKEKYRINLLNLNTTHLSFLNLEYKEGRSILETCVRRLENVKCQT